MPNANPLEATFRGAGHTRQPGCTWQAHFRQVAALSEAMQHAAQLEMAGAVVQYEEARGAFAHARSVSDQAGINEAVARMRRAEAERERAYGKWLGAKGFLRLAEGSTYDLTDTEREMLALIDWKAEVFQFPGIEAFPALSEQCQPGAAA